MEVPIECDPDFGGGEEEDLSPEWQEAAKINVNDDPALRVSRLKAFREALVDRKIHLRLINDELPRISLSNLSSSFMRG